MKKLREKIKKEKKLIMRLACGVNIFRCLIKTSAICQKL
jgi:hypothetical protein